MKIEIEGLQALAAKLGVTVEYLWAVLLKQAPISAAIDLAFAVFVFILCFVAYHYRGKIEKAWDDASFAIIFIILGTIVLAILIVFAVLCVFFAVTPIVNPEYWALKEILSAIGTK